MIKIALSKGRIYQETLPLLARMGILPAEDLETSRKLIIATNHPAIELVVIRATDVPTYVDYGAADLGVAGKDVLMEYGGATLYEPVDLHIARCRLMTAAPIHAAPCVRRLRVATKYTKIAKEFYAAQGVQAEVIKLYGSMELAPLVGLADEIVDLVDTGNTLRANGLEPRQHIADISSRLVVNKAALKMKTGLVRELIDLFRTVAQQPADAKMLG